MTRRGRFAVLAASLILLTLAAGPVAAARPGTESFSFSQSGLSAQAFSGDCTENTDGTVTCTFSDLFVFAGRTHDRGEGAVRRSDVCYSTYTDTWNAETGEGISFTYASGCTETSVEFADDLSSVTVSPTTITLSGETCTWIDPETEPECTPIEPTQVVVEGTFTATGPVTRQSHRSFYDDGVCVSRDSSSGYSRSAAFVGTVDGEPFEAMDAFLEDGRFSYRVTCSLE